MTLRNTLAAAITVAAVGATGVLAQDETPTVETAERSCTEIMTELEDAVTIYTGAETKTATGAMKVADAYRDAIEEIPIRSDNSNRCGDKKFAESLKSQANIYAGNSATLLFDHKLQN